MRILLLSLFAWTLLLQNNYGQQQQLNIKKVSEEIVLDGNIDEQIWANNDVATDFWQFFPSDSTKAEDQTEIFFTYNDDYIYIAAKCYNVENKHITQSLKRDYQAFGSDNITFIFDTYNDLTNSFVFGINAYGVRREGLVANGGNNRDDFSDSWDNKWRGVSKIHDGYWACELAIPLNSIRFKDGENIWGFNSYRFNTQRNEITTWANIPQNQKLTNLSYMGEIHWEEPLKKHGKNIAIIPYVTGNLQKENQTGLPYEEFTLSIGGDAKIGITSGLNLDLTINPDFSQVEVDNEIANLSRFELFLPEKRQFFLENADLFGGFGNQRTNPFFSRRIGLVENSDGDLEQNAIVGGLRLSGKLNNDWRVGILNMQTAQNMDLNLPQYNYSIASIQRKVFERSNIGFIFTNKQAIGLMPDSTTNYSAYDRVAGIDYNLNAANGKLQGKIFYHHNFSDDTGYKPFDKFAHGVDLKYFDRNVKIQWVHDWIRADYNPEIGFTPRNDYFRISPEIEYYFYPSNSILNRYALGTQATIFWRPDYGQTDHQLELFWNPIFKDNSNLKIILQHNYTYLTQEDDFNPLSDSIFLPNQQGYNYINIRGRYFSDNRKVITYTIRPNFGQFYNGHRYSLGGDVNCRLSYFGSVGVAATYNYIDFSEKYGQGIIWVAGPKIDLTFTKNLFLSALVQYNSQDDDFIVNARLQWRFKPVSDFFIVYTDNYRGSDFMQKERAIVAKFTYWFNL